MELFCLKNTNLSELSEEGEAGEEAQDSKTTGLECQARSLNWLLGAMDTMLDLRATGWRGRGQTGTRSCCTIPSPLREWGRL